jgi:thioredoxin 1
VKEINAVDWESEVAKEQIPVFVDFWAPWCGPCRVLAPTIEDIAREQKSELKFVKVNVDDNPSVAIAFNIQSIPTIGIFKNGKLLNTAIGAQSKSSLEKFIDDTISKV